MLNKDHLSIFITASKDKTRPVLTSVRFTADTVDNKNVIRLASTDGYRLAEKVIDIDFKPTWEELLIPASTVEMVSKILKKHHRVLISENQFKIMNVKDDPDGYLERTITIGETIDGNYPEYESLLPTGEPIASAIVNKKYIIDALKQFDGHSVIVEIAKTSSDQKSIIIKDINDDTSTMSLIMPLKE